MTRPRRARRKRPPSSAGGSTTWSSAPAGTLLYVSDWAGTRVLAVDPDELPHRRRRSPSASTRTRWSSTRRTGACSSPARPATPFTSSTRRRASSPKRSTPACSRRRPEGSTPGRRSPSRRTAKTLYVANADNNCVAVVDVEKPSESDRQGLHPHRVVPDRRRRHAGRQEPAGRRRQGQPDSKPNPLYTKEQTSRPTKADCTTRGGLRRFPYIGTTLSRVAVHRAGARREDARRSAPRQVYKNCPYSDALLTAAPHPDADRRSRTAVGDAVADQVRDLRHQGEPDLRPGVRRPRGPKLGDKAKGNGDPALVHASARR